MDILNFSNFKPKNHKRFFAVLLPLALFILAALTCQTTQLKPDGVRRIVFLHLNDSHGHFYGKLDKDQRPAEGYNLENLAGYVASIEQEDGVDAVILSFGGDLNTGTPESAYLQAAPDFELFSHAGMKVAVIGNHEFDNPREVLEKQIKHSPFPWISANIFKENKTLLTKPFEVISAAGLRIGFIGLTTEQTAQIGNPQFISGFQFLDAKKEAQKHIDGLRDKTDFLIALTHLGLYPSGKVPHNAVDDRQLAEHTKGLDLILGGHSHSLVAGEIINSVPVFQAKCFGEHLIRVDYDIYPRNTLKQAVLAASAVIDLKKAPEQLSAKAKEKREQARKITEKYLAQSQKIFSEEIAEAVEDFHYQREHVIPSAIGKLVVKSQLIETKAQIAITIAGGVRGGLKKGKITLRDVLTVAPFNNSMGIVQLSGKEIAELLQDKLNSSDKGAYPLIAGLQHSQEGTRWKFSFENKPLDFNKKYSVAFNSYMAAGGSGYPDFVAAGRFVDLGISDAMVLKNFLQKQKKISYELVK